MAKFIEVHDTRGNARYVNTDEITEVTGNTIYVRTIAPFAADYLYITCTETYEEIKQMLKNEEQTTACAYWIKQLDDTYYCSHCGREATYNYDGAEIRGTACCYCGARMDGEQE